MITISIQFSLSSEILKELASLIAKKITSQTQEKAPVSYSVKEVANILKVKPSTIRAYIHKGLLKHTQTGKSYIISKSSLDEYLKRHGQE